MDKIKALEKALNNLGIKTKLYPEMVWSCTDGKKHYGIELDTDIVCDCETVEFLFTPSGDYIYSALDAPVLQEEKANKNEKKEKEKMTEKKALVIANDVLNDTLYEMEQNHDDEYYPEYYQELKDAIEVIKKMSKALYN